MKNNCFKGIVTFSTILLSFALTGAETHAERKSNPENSFHQDFMRVTGITSRPIGHVRFCEQNAHICRVKQNSPAVVALDEQLWFELQRINSHVNQLVKPVSDFDLYGHDEVWAYPTSLQGDCEDYVLLKQRMLADRGWPPEALLITVVRDEYGGGHAVLTVRTDYGEFILDNQRPDVEIWHQTPYEYLKRQSVWHAAAWVDVAAPAARARTIIHN